MRPTTLLVKATHADRPCPTIESAKGPRIDRKTKRDRRKIYHDEVREVPRVAFYLRRVRAGDLMIVKQAKPTPAPRPTTKKVEG